MDNAEMSVNTLKILVCYDDTAAEREYVTIVMASLQHLHVFGFSSKKFIRVTPFFFIFLHRLSSTYKPK